jgi:hypothetical protein
MSQRARIVIEIQYPDSWPPPEGWDWSNVLKGGVPADEIDVLSADVYRSGDMTIEQAVTEFERECADATARLKER